MVQITINLKMAADKMPLPAEEAKEEPPPPSPPPEKEKKFDLGVDGIMRQVWKSSRPPCKVVKVIVEPYVSPEILWWQRPSCNYAFRHPKVRSTLERLMGSNLVRLTDRNYILQLHQRIFEDYVTLMEKRIEVRVAQEKDRQKQLVLRGLISLDEAPKEMANHPVLLINAFCEKLIAERRAKIKVQKVVIPLMLYLDDSPDPPPGLSIIEGHIFRKAEDAVCVPPQRHLDSTTEDDIEMGYMFNEKDYEKKKKYEDPRVKDLLTATTVEMMYSLGDDIVGPLKTMKDTTASTT